jgi:hypothetical protein
LKIIPSILLTKSKEKSIARGITHGNMTNNYVFFRNHIQNALKAGHIHCLDKKMKVYNNPFSKTTRVVAIPKLEEQLSKEES